MKASDGNLLLVKSPQHLGEIVQSVRSDWGDPWTNAYTQLLGKRDWEYKTAHYA